MTRGICLSNLVTKANIFVEKDDNNKERLTKLNRLLRSLDIQSKLKIRDENKIQSERKKIKYLHWIIRELRSGKKI